MVSRLKLFLALAALFLLPVSSSAQETIEYYGLDAIGSVRIVFDVNGNVLARTDYEPFGQIVSSTGNAPDRKFAQLFRDAEAGLDYAQARAYQTRTGRFSSPDPVYAGLFEPQLWNRYSYALNSPVSLTDPTGLCPECPPTYTETVTVIGAHGFIDLFSSFIKNIFDDEFTVGRQRPRGGRPGGGGRGGRAQPPPSTAPPDDPLPPDPPKPPPPPAQENDCHGVARQLADVSPSGSVGIQMMLDAHKDVWRDANTVGFKQSLAGPEQGNDVYRHIYGHAGAIVVNNPAGSLASNLAMMKDVGQLLKNKPGAKDEVRGSIAGMAVGAIMSSVQGPTTKFRWITRTICE